MVIKPIMTRKPITVEPDTSMEEAARIMLKEVISCLPVVSSSGSIQGILSMKDILTFYTAEE
jgi:acetoin utilization protein AcuB